MNMLEIQQEIGILRRDLSPGRHTEDPVMDYCDSPSKRNNIVITSGELKLLVTPFHCLSIISSEVQKMYGHNNGVVCITISHCGRWLASASKARDRDTAVILLWDAAKYALPSTLLPVCPSSHPTICPPLFVE
jgi:WD40 repeat protein